MTYMAIAPVSLEVLEDILEAVKLKSSRIVHLITCVDSCKGLR